MAASFAPHTAASSGVVFTTKMPSSNTSKRSGKYVFGAIRVSTSVCASLSDATARCNASAMSTSLIVSTFAFTASSCALKSAREMSWNGFGWRFGSSDAR